MRVEPVGKLADVGGRAAAGVGALEVAQVVGDVAGGDDQEGLEEMADDLWIESDYYCYIEEYLDAQFSEDIKALLNNGEENNEDDLAPHQ